MSDADGAALRSLAEALVHVALQRWRIYPAGLFALQRTLGGVPVWRCRDPDVCAYVARALNSTERAQLSGAIEAFVVRAIDGAVPVAELVVRPGTLAISSIDNSVAAVLGGVLDMAMQRVPLIVSPRDGAERTFEVSVELRSIYKDAQTESSGNVAAKAGGGAAAYTAMVCDGAWAVDVPAAEESWIISAVRSVRSLGLDVFCRIAPHYSCR